MQMADKVLLYFARYPPEEFHRTTPTNQGSSVGPTAPQGRKEAKGPHKDPAGLATRPRPGPPVINGAMGPTRRGGGGRAPQLSKGPGDTS